MENKVPINEDEFDRLPDYVQGFIKQSHNGELPPTNENDLKEAINKYFITQTSKVEEIKDDERGTSIAESK